jgi:hypothetical protein
MKSFAIFAIIAATVSAEKGYECATALETWSEVDNDSTISGAKTSEACGAACTAVATDQTTKDHCCMFVDEVDTDTAKTTTDKCGLLEKDTKTGDVANVKSKKAAVVVGTKTSTYYSWAWNAGKKMADMTPATETTTTTETKAEAAKDSASMITSAVATIAAIAMVAL